MPQFAVTLAPATHSLPSSTPSDSLPHTASPSVIPILNPTPTESLDVALVPSPMVTLTLPPTPTPLPTLTPSTVPTRLPAATHSATFVQSADDPRFEEYRPPPYPERKGPPGIKPHRDRYGSAYPIQLSIEQQTGDIIVAWRNYDYQYYYDENNIMPCYDTHMMLCRERPGYFAYDQTNDYWNFVKDLNISLPVSDPAYLWWGLNKYFQSTLDPSGFDLTTYKTGPAILLDMVANRFWVYQMIDMPADVNGATGSLDTTPGIPYPPVRVPPGSWVPSSSPRGFITLHNALTYSPGGLYFLESESPEYTLRIHYFSFALPPTQRVWTTKTFAFKTGPFRSLSIDNAIAPQAAFSKRDNTLYFMNRYWEVEKGNELKTLVRVKESDAI